MLGFDPVGSFLAALFMLTAVGAAAMGLTIGGIQLLVAWRYRHARPSAALAPV